MIFVNKALPSCRHGESKWDDTSGWHYIKGQYIYPHIAFRNEPEVGRQIAFLDVLVNLTDNISVQAGVSRKKTNGSICILWNSYFPKTWKSAKNKEDFDKELALQKRVFAAINEYLHSLAISVTKKTLPYEERSNAGEKCQHTTVIEEIHCHIKSASWGTGLFLPSEISLQSEYHRGDLRKLKLSPNIHIRVNIYHTLFP